MWERISRLLPETLPARPEVFGCLGAPLIAETDLDYLIGRRLSRQALRVTLRGRALPEELYCQVDDVLPNGKQQPFVDRDRVVDLLRSGATGIVSRADLLFPEIEEVSNGLEDRTRTPWKASLFMTGRGAQGLKPHLDGESVIVIQLAGSKSWMVSRLPVEQNATITRNLTPEETEAADWEEWQLKVGDVAWIPRGFAHQAAANETGSVHVSMAAEALTWWRLVSDFVDRVAREHPETREQLPADYWKGGPEVAKEIVDRLLLVSQEMQSSPEVAEELAADLAAEQYWMSRRGQKGGLAAALGGKAAESRRQLVDEDNNATAVVVDREAALAAVGAERAGKGRASTTAQ
ncbi:JmjC domain-containing protein [Kribbella sp. DT2]|uniref:JmjC domain-containing protein n=1 Tax=Kribbella sp. DT2 TaxID=3393427 RepID=UPI003CFB32D5